ncbi:phosphatase [Yersinia phage vB_YenM_P778]
MGVTKIVRGDIISLADKHEVDLVAHGCNCRNIMGAGIAKSISTAWPQALQNDKAQYERLGGRDHEEVKELAGKFTSCTLPNGVRVVNLYTQIDMGANAEYQYVEASAKALYEFAMNRGVKRIAIPLIGCGIGGLAAPAVLSIFNSIFKDIDVVVVVYQGDLKTFTKLTEDWGNFSTPNVTDGRYRVILKDGSLVPEVTVKPEGSLKWLTVKNPMSELKVMCTNNGAMYLTIGNVDHRVYAYDTTTITPALVK